LLYLLLSAGFLSKNSCCMVYFQQYLLLKNLLKVNITTTIFSYVF
jgi:hypothetical protein